MFLTKFGIERPVVVRMALILIIIIGIYCYRSMPRYLDPDLTIGEAVAVTIVPGFSPEEIEKLVTNKIEDKLQGISEIRRIESRSFEGTSYINISFQTELSEEEIDQGVQEVRNAIDQVDDLPDEAKVPMVLEIDIAIFPVCLVGLYGDLPMMQLQDIAEDISEILEDIKGVSEVEIQGKREKEIWVELNPFRMSGYNISISELAYTISNRSRNVPGGVVEMGDHETAIRMVGEPRSPRELEQLVLRSRDGGIVYLGDVAKVTPTLEKARALNFIDKKNALVLSVKRRKNVNMIQIVDDVKAHMATIQGQYPGLKTTLYFDQSKVIKQRIKELQINALLGIIAVFIILWTAIGLRNAVYASIGIPVAFLLTFCFMKFFHLSIDGLTLFGLILVLGILVDDAIVVLENIFRHIERGVSPAKAALIGSREVLAPVLAAVSTNMAAFFPLLFVLTGLIGRYMSLLPMVILFALAASLFEVFFMLPSHVVELTPAKAVKRAIKRKGVDIFTPLRRIYYPYLKIILLHRYISVLVILLSTILAIFLYFQTDFEMFPKTDAFPRFNIHFDMPVGSTLERTRDTIMELNDLVKKGIGDDLVDPIAAVGMKEVNYEPIYGSHYGMISVILKDAKERRHNVVELMEGIREDVERLLTSRGATAFVLERLLEGPPVGADMDLKIQSSNWDSSAAIAHQIREELSRHKGIVDIRDNFSREKQFLEITVDEVKAKTLGIDQGHLVMAVQAAFYGLPVATYNQGDEEQDIRLKYMPEFRRDFDDLMNLKINAPGYGTIPLKDVAYIEMRPGFNNIYHYNGKPTVRVTANIRSVQEDKKGISGFMSNFSGERMTAMKANSIARAYFDDIKEGFPGARMIAGGLQEETEQ
ncbi:MAG: efflux RND transporter permease subunit [Deltaproteobacteria bacterium]|nr:efflux RND transporter permease subunit [Deltaproteobacteria bacterium]